MAVRAPLVVLVVSVVSSGCGTPPELALQRLLEARRLSSELLVEFTRGADATNRAVMAASDDVSTAAKADAERAAQVIGRNVAALRPLLEGLGYSDEQRIVDEFTTRFAAYRELDRSVLNLAVANSNVEAQELSFGLATEAADAFRVALETLKPRATGETWRLQALGATAVAELRAIQVLQPPHIAEADDAAMTRMEAQMARATASVRAVLATLATIIQPTSGSQLDAATAALDRFIGLNDQIVALSRRNTNVRSLALAIGRMRMLTAACDDSLGALQAALAARGFTGTR